MTLLEELAPPVTGARGRGALAASAARSALVVDARMLFSSGIGRYLREVIRRWPAAGATCETYVVNDPEQHEWLAQERPGAAFVSTRAGIYSLGEQRLAWSLPRTSVYWVPHYNAPWRCAARLVTTVHDAAPLVLREAFPRLKQRLAARFYFRAVRRSAARVLTVSNFTAGELVARVGIPRLRIEVVPNGVDEVWGRAAAVRPARPPERLLYVGNLKAHKNIARLLDAIELVRRRSNRDVTLEVVGQAGGFRAGLESSTAGRLASSPWVTCHGRIDDTRLRELYAAAGALVFPSLYEGFGLPVLEAMAAGCPVLASRQGALVEVGGPEGADGGVRYFDPRDANDIAERLETFLRLAPAERARMAEVGRRRALLFSWHVAASRTYRTLMREIERARHERFIL